MKLIESNANHCVPASFAMVLGVSMEDLFKALGHDGLDVILKDEEEPYCFRSFHPQEFVDYCLNLHYSMTMIELHPKMIHGKHVVDHSEFLGEDRFFRHMLIGNGVIFGAVPKGDDVVGHAVAWNRREKLIYDPRGRKYGWEEGMDFHPRQFFLIEEVGQP